MNEKQIRQIKKYLKLGKRDRNLNERLNN